MKKILITGSVMNSNNESIKLFDELVNICTGNDCEIFSPLDTMKFTGNDEEKYVRAMNLLDKADFVIAEMSIPSTGQGMELQQAVINDIPILIIAKKDSKISGLIKGSKKVVDILFYDDINDIKEKVQYFIKNIKKIKVENWR